MNILSLHASYSDNLNGVGDKFRSQRWTVELSRTLEDGEDAGSVSRIMLEIARGVIDREKREQSNNNGFISGNGSSPALPYPVNQTPMNGNARPASEKQIKYLFQLAKRNGSMSDEQIRGLPTQYFGKKSLSELTSKESSQIIDVFAEQRKAA